MIVKFELNGRQVVKDVAPGETLLETLRKHGISSVRSGCDTANCGICTVWVNGDPVLSCSYPSIRIDGKCVTTLEGVRPEAEELMAALAEEGADQCGFCSPGFLMAAIAMLRELDAPTEEEIRTYLSGNLCRCTGYMSQARALKKVYEKRGAK